MLRLIGLSSLLLAPHLDAKKGHSMSVTMKFDPAMISHLEAATVSPQLTMKNNDMAIGTASVKWGERKNNTAVSTTDGANKHPIDCSEEMEKVKASLLNQIDDLNHQAFVQQKLRSDSSKQILDMATEVEKLKRNFEPKPHDTVQDCPQSSSTMDKMQWYSLSTMGILTILLLFALVQKRSSNQQPVEFIAKTLPSPESQVQQDTTLHQDQSYTSSRKNNENVARTSIKMKYTDLEKKEEDGREALSSIKMKYTDLEKKEEDGREAFSSIKMKYTDLEKKEEDGREALSLIKMKYTDLEKKEEDGREAFSSIKMKYIDLEKKEEDGREALSSIKMKYTDLEKKEEDGREAFSSIKMKYIDLEKKEEDGREALSLIKMKYTDLEKKEEDGREALSSIKVKYIDLEKKEEILSSRIWELECEVLRINIDFASSTSLQISNHSSFDGMKAELHDVLRRLEESERERNKASNNLIFHINRYDEQINLMEEKNILLASLQAERDALKVHNKILTVSMKVELSRVNLTEKKMNESDENNSDDLMNVIKERDKLLDSMIISDNIISNLNEQLLSERNNIQSMIATQIIQNQENKENLRFLQEKSENIGILESSSLDLQNKVENLVAHRDRLRKKAAMLRFGMDVDKIGINNVRSSTHSEDGAFELFSSDDVLDDVLGEEDEYFNDENDTSDNSGFALGIYTYARGGEGSRSISGSNSENENHSESENDVDQYGSIIFSSPFKDDSEFNDQEEIDLNERSNYLNTSSQSDLTVIDGIQIRKRTPRKVQISLDMVTISDDENEDDDDDDDDVEVEVSNENWKKNNIKNKIKSNNNSPIIAENNLSNQNDNENEKMLKINLMNNTSDFSLPEKEKEESLFSSISSFFYSANPAV